MSFVDDTLRERLAEALHAVDKKAAASNYGVTFRDWSALPEPAREDYYEYADALLPLIPRHQAYLPRVGRRRRNEGHAMKLADPEYYDDAWTREDHRAKAIERADFSQYRILRDDQKMRLFAEAQLHAILALSAPEAGEAP